VKVLVGSQNPAKLESMKEEKLNAKFFVGMEVLNRGLHLR